MSFSLENKVALVTGAGGPLGRGIAIALAKAGANVLVNDIDAQLAAQTVELVRHVGAKAMANFADITDSRQVNSMISEAADQLGGVDILVNNAGGIGDGLIQNLSDEAWEAALKLNMTGTFNCTRAVVSRMIEHGYGRIINISSMSYRGNIGQVNYCAAKAGVVGMTQALGLELATNGITVNCIAPGLIKTPKTESFEAEMRDRILKRIPMRSMGEPEDVAAAVVFFASDEARYITRQILHVSGGSEGM
ncbi:3-oxoacyl-ACP reductase FabG [Paraburkholderia sp. HP33-1]|uniref:3-oxoacyl-ACP reductase FabG n=1 Tax=Paraburkholderia sp. HP33-1 TaxID=2883243 RepID=UPI001F3FAAD4|nr:3-oxoacyl-ACP reductase FabG [Paraburkholderia sp. HP33-1]